MKINDTSGAVVSSVAKPSGEAKSVIEALSGDMTILEFAATTISAIAWPIAAVWIAFIFRAQISALLRRIKGANWGEATVTFADALDEIEDQVPPADPTVEKGRNQVDIQVAADLGRFDALLEISPNAAILDSWRSTEAMIRAKAKELNFRNDDGSKASIVGLTRHLAAFGKWPSEIPNIVVSMRELRNRAAHGGDVSRVDAYRFAGLAARISDLLAE